MKVAIETPVFKGGYLQECIDSVLAQSSPDWTLWLLWDGGDAQSREILERLDATRNPRVQVYFAENRGIAGARRFLSEHSDGEYILPLDDDDILPPNAVERFLACAREKPWASLIRARRQFIDTAGKVVEDDPWFPFGPRNYELGMVSDIFNQTQPYLIKRSAYERTGGWEGFPDFMFAGEDCDIFLKLEEVGPFELLDETLYHYRLHPGRTSETLKPESAFEMWRRLADMTIKRIGLPIARTNDMPPFHYERVPVPASTRAMVDFVVAADPTDVAVSSLRRCGVAPDAIHVVEGAGGKAARYAEGFRRTARPLVCFVDGAVDLGGGAALDALLGAMNEQGADLVGPRIVDAAGGVVSGKPGFDASGCPVTGDAGAGIAESPWLPGDLLLVRREVPKAIGGFDCENVSDALAPVDFCLAARQRGFKCVHAGSAEVVLHRPGTGAFAAEDVRALQRKWSSHRQLLGLS